MKLKIENWKKSPFVLSLVTSIPPFLLTVCYDYFKDKPVFTTFFSILKWLGKFLWSILNFDLKVWWVVLSIIIFFFIIIIITRFQKEDVPLFLSYKEDKFKNWKWTWDWRFSNRKKAWTISNMQAHCPNCDTSMIDRSDSIWINFECPRCGFMAHGNQCDEPYKIERIIFDNIDRNFKN